MEDNYPRAYKEVIEILNYVPEESVNKIPKTVIETFKINMDNEYDFEIDVNKTFEEQELLNETRAIFANIFRDYWANSYQRERIEAKEKYDRQKNEEEKKLKYNSDIFNKSKIQNDAINKQLKKEINNLPIEVKEKSFFYKIKNFFKKYLI